MFSLGGRAMRLSEVHWITPDQLKVLAKHHILTLGELATFETADSMADVIPVDGLRALARTCSGFPRA